MDKSRQKRHEIHKSCCSEGDSCSLPCLCKELKIPPFSSSAPFQETITGSRQRELSIASLCITPVLSDSPQIVKGLSLSLSLSLIHDYWSEVKKSSACSELLIELVTMAAVVEWEVGSSEDVIPALMERLVDPKLPCRVSENDEPPSEEDQQAIARQMHAVVLLYNYYHRKQKPDLEFLSFTSFCNLAPSLRPSLISFMKESNDQISPTAKAIKDACEIAMALDASKESPTTKAWPISKVAVLLIDYKDEDCLLQYSAVTEGVWSLIEREINDSNGDQEILLADEKAAKKRKLNGEKAAADESKFLLLAYDAVKVMTGIDRSDLEVLESSVVYSLSKEKSTAQFYMMRCSCSFSVGQSVPLKFLAEGLSGPLAKEDFGSWSVTELVEYYHMFPYVESISHWLSRKDLCSPILNGDNTGTNMNVGKKKLPRITAPVSILPNCNGKDLNHFTNQKSETKVRSPDELAMDNATKKLNKRCEENISQKLKKKSGVANYDARSSDKTAMGNAMKKLNKKCEENISQKLEKKSTAAHYANEEESGIFCGSLGNDSGKISSGSSFAEDTGKKLNSRTRVYHHKRKNTSSEDGVDLVEMKGPFKSNDILCKDEKTNGISVKESQQPLFEASDNIEAQNVVASEDLQNALALLYRKRQELFSQIRTMEDAFVICEDIIERIRDDGEVSLACRCIKSILSGNDNLLLKSENQTRDNGKLPRENCCNPETQKQSRLSEIFLPGRSSCQDLEYTCIKNHWRLPRYFLEPSHGKFASTVAVESKNFKLSMKGDLESSPGEARESAAAQMIAKIMKVCVSNGDQT